MSGTTGNTGTTGLSGATGEIIIHHEPCNAVIMSGLFSIPRRFLVIRGVCVTAKLALTCYGHVRRCHRLHRGHRRHCCHRPHRCNRHLWTHRCKPLKAACCILSSCLTPLCLGCTALSFAYNSTVYRRTRRCCKGQAAVQAWFDVHVQARLDEQAQQGPLERQASPASRVRHSLFCFIHR